MITFKEFIVEKRRNSTQNIQLSTEDQLKKLNSEYGDRLFIRYTNTPKLGANPLSTFDTPLGIYAYPLSYIIKNNFKVPWAGQSRYIVVFVVNSNIKLWNFDDNVNKYVNPVIDAMINVFKERVRGGTFKDNKELWYYMYAQAKRMLWTGDTNPMAYINANPGKVGVLVRKVLRTAGFDGVVDNGHGIIHENEPTQAIFFNTKTIKALDVLDTNIGISKSVGFYKDNEPNFPKLLSFYYEVTDDDTGGNPGTFLEVFSRYYKGKKLMNLVTKLGNWMLTQPGTGISWFINNDEANQLVPYGFSMEKYHDKIEREES